MQSSRNFFKNEDTNTHSEVKKIETFYTPKSREVTGSKESLTVSEMKQLEYNFNEIQREKEKQLINELNKEKYDFKKLIQKEKAKFFKELIELRQAVLVKAEDESNEIKEVAYQLGLKEGQKDGYETGVQEGYIAGQLEAESLKENAHKIMEQTTEAIEIYKKEKQMDFIRVAAVMAENIIHHELSLSEDKLKLLLQPVLNQLEKVENFISIYVTKDNLENTNSYMEKMKESFSDLKFAVLVDESLEKNGCIIETNYEVIDLQIQKQLDLMVKDLYEGDYDG